MTEPTMFTSNVETRQQAYDRGYAVGSGNEGAYQREIARLRAALEFLYDKWENGDPCYEDADSTGVSLGNAFRLSEAEEAEILALIPQQCTHLKLSADGFAPEAPPPTSKPIRQQSAMELMETHCAALQAEIERLCDFLQLWIYEGRLQSFEDRERFRHDAKSLLWGDSPPAPETSAPSRGSIEYAIEVLKRYRDGSDPDCTCDDCPQCGRLPAECSGTQCAQTCQCSECDHCRVVAAIAGLGSSQETSTELPEGLRDPIKVMERVRAMPSESPLAAAIRVARGDVGPPTEPVKFGEKASGERRPHRDVRVAGCDCEGCQLL